MVFRAVIEQWSKTSYLKVKSCKLYDSKYMMASIKIKNSKIFDKPAEK